jgi:vacuolar-type H+-ATPase subunit H
MSTPQQDIDELIPNLSERVQEIITAAVEAAGRLRDDLEKEAAQHADTLRSTAETDARRIRDEAEADVTTYVRDARTRIQTFANERIARLAAVTDRLIDQSDQLQQRFEAAEVARKQIYELIAAIGSVAEQLAHENEHLELATPDTPKLMPPQTGEASEK